MSMVLHFVILYMEASSMKFHEKMESATVMLLHFHSRTYN